MVVIRNNVAWLAPGVRKQVLSFEACARNCGVFGQTEADVAHMVVAIGLVCARLAIVRESVIPFDVHGTTTKFALGRVREQVQVQVSSEHRPKFI